MKAGNFSAYAELEVSPRGLAAIGFLVSGILLSVAPIIWVSRRKP